MNKQQKENQQIARIIERQQVISYKRKPTNKLNKDSDDDIESANSLKSGVYSDDSVRFSKKNTPLPELGREKKRMFTRNLAGGIGSQQVNNYLEKQVRQHDNLVLKQKNNHLTSENMKLKTKVMTLEKENSRLNKIIEEQSTKIKQPGLHGKDIKLKGSQNLSLKMTLKNLRKQLDDQKKQNEKIKWSIKFTRINQLQCERDAILAETARLRQLLEDEQIKKITYKNKEQGMSNLQHKVHTLGEKNLALIKENSQLQNKLKKIEENSKRFKQSTENEKNLNRLLFNAKRIIKQKERQIETLKSQTEAKIESLNSINQVKSVKEVAQRGFVNKNKNKEKRIMSKSAQKYRKNPSAQMQGCQNCEKLTQQNVLLEKKIEDLSLALKKQKQNSMARGLGDFRREQIDAATDSQTEEICRFLTFRFKAHHLSLQEAERYLINSQLNEKTLSQEASVIQIAQSLVAEPFSIISNTYLQICLMKLFYAEECKRGEKITITQQKKLKKSELVKNFRDIIHPFEIMGQEKQEEMFIQIAELVTNYHQHILTALNRKKNGQGTISEVQLCNFFAEIQLQKEFVDFIICQIILQSLDLDHLNYYTMFEIFYMPNQGGLQQQVGAVGPDQPNKKKFQVDHSQVVKEEDEEYEESRSYVEGKQKTQSRREDEQVDLDVGHIEQKQEDEGGYQNVKIQQHEKEYKDDDEGEQNEYEKEEFNEGVQQDVEDQIEEKNENALKDKSQVREKKNIDEYNEYSEQQKMEQLPSQENGHKQEVEDQEKPYMMEEVMDEYQQEFQD